MFVYFGLVSMFARAIYDHSAIEHHPTRTTASKNIITVAFISTESDLTTFLEFRVDSQCVMQCRAVIGRLIKPCSDVKGHIMDLNKGTHLMWYLLWPHAISQRDVLYSKAQLRSMSDSAQDKQSLTLLCHSVYLLISFRTVSEPWDVLTVTEVNVCSTWI